MSVKNVLLLGGTLEARRLAGALSRRPDLRLELSLAGRTRAPLDNGVTTRHGGFGGARGLADYLRTRRIDALIVATHPFAAQIAHNAFEAAERTGVAALRLARPGWVRTPEDRWIECDTPEAAPALIGATPRRVFLTFGRAQAALFERAPQHSYLIRSIDPLTPALSLPHMESLLDRGPFTLEGERRLLQHHRIDTLVTKESGGASTYPKIEAARALGVRVIMIRRPAMPALPTISSECPDCAARVCAWLDARGA